MSENNQTISKPLFYVSVDMFTEDSIDPNKIWGNDELKRRPFADDLTSIVRHAAMEQSFAVSLHGVWGTGKTYLLRRWQMQLQKYEGTLNRPRVIYFNAWKDDFQADALTAIVGQLWADIKSSDWKEIIRSAKKAVPTITRRKALGFLGLTKKDLQSTDERTVDEYLAVRKKLDGFRERLGILAKAVKVNTGFPLVLIVDELDRCRPTFAIEVLERVKHLFGVPYIVFVFGINKTALQKSIESVYGDIDAEDYLCRFFDISLTLPPANAEAYCLHLLSKHDDLRAVLGGKFDLKAKSWQPGTKRFLAPLAGYMDLSLRQVEHAIRLLRLAIDTQNMPSKNSRSGVILENARGICLLILLKIKCPDMYKKFIGGKCYCADVINYFVGYLPGHSAGSEGVDFKALFGFEDEIAEEIYCLARGHNEAPETELNYVLQGLEFLQYGEAVPDNELVVLAETTRKLNRECAKQLRDALIQRRGLRAHDGDKFRNDVAALLDLTDDSR